MIVKTRTELRDFSGHIIGFIEEDAEGNQQLRNFYGKILGFYNKKENKTRDFYGRIKAQGNALSMLVQK